MSYKEKYEEWLQSPVIDEDTKAELRAVASDEDELYDRFYTQLEFGTAGLRGVIGAGENRMNGPQGYPGTGQLYQGPEPGSYGRCHRL